MKLSSLASNVLRVLSSTSVVLVLAGCSVSFNPTPSATTASVGALQGNVHGGQQGVSNAHVYVMQVGTSAYGAASTSLITSNYGGSDAVGKYVLTDRFGSFSVTGDYLCTSGAQVYILAEQGNPGLDAGTNNPAIALMASVGACPATGTLALAVPYVTVNEVSTVAMAYALAGFAVDATHIANDSSASGNRSATLAITGLNNAAAAVPNIMSVATGTAYAATAATGSTGVVPQAEINTLANVLASCINAANALSGGCPTLFANATKDGTNSTATGNVPAETATAAINIAHHPAQNPSALCGLQSATAPFQPALPCLASAPPNDFTVKLYYTGGGLSGSSQNAVDGSGNIWVSNPGNNTLSKFSPLGVLLSGATGFTGGGLSTPYGVAIDTLGNAWVANLGGKDVSKFSSAGVSQAGTTGFLGNNDLTPYQIAIDTAGDVWTTNLYQATVSELNSNGTETLNTSNTAPGDFGSPAGIAIDAMSQVWVSDEAAEEILVLNHSTGNVNSDLFCNSNCRFLELTSGISPFAWISNFTGYISEGNPNTGTAANFGGGGLNQSTSNILDGAGHIWVTNYNGVVSEFNSAGTAITPGTGYTSTLSKNYGIAVDGSGNVWVTDSGTTTGTQLMEILGAATPTVTPLVQAAINNNIAGRP